jgi:protein-S-isoprenylcysteine O-methyltransferase Ste14
MNVALKRAAPLLLKARRRHTLWFAVFVTLLLLVTGSAWPVEGATHENLEWLGYALVIVGVLGRVACAAYIGGRKNEEIIVDGPYSVVRNPLYVFSFIGVAGIGLGTGTVTVPAVLLAVFALYYGRVVAHEEAYLLARFQADYLGYMRNVPRWWPKPGLWRSPQEMTIRPKFILLTIRDSAIFFVAYPVLELLDWLHEAGILPVLLSLR